MSKWGAHISEGNHRGLGEAMKQCAEAGSPIPVLYSLDQNVMPDVVKYSPKTLVIYRTQIHDKVNPPGIWFADPLESADSWYAEKKPNWDLNPAHFYSPSNEMDPQTLEHFRWWNTFDLRIMQRADADGIKLAIDGHSTGTPNDDGGIDRYQKWACLVPALQYAKAHGHVLLLHEYGFDKTLPDSAPHHALRHRSVLDFLEKYNADPKVVISECSDGGGYSGRDQTWMSNLIWYDQQVMPDDRILGFCAYQLGGAENWYKLIPKWAEYVATHPNTPVVVEPPKPQMKTFRVTVLASDEVALCNFVALHGGRVES